MLFTIEVKEVHTQCVEVEAETYTEAVDKVNEGEGDTSNHSPEYSRTMDLDTWTGYDEEDNFYDGSSYQND